MRFQSDKAEQMRLKAHYKRLALEGRPRGLPVDALKSIVGPDCAYHLYWAAGVENSSAAQAEPIESSPIKAPLT